MRRLFFALKHSLQGFNSAFKTEEAFRIEVFVSAFLIPLAYYLTDNMVEFAILVSGVFSVLLAELINSAIEATIDRISLERHELSKNAKDIGSAAVFLSLCYCAFVWIVIVLV